MEDRARRKEVREWWAAKKAGIKLQSRRPVLKRKTVQNKPEDNQSDTATTESGNKVLPF